MDFRDDKFDALCSKIQDRWLIRLKKQRCSTVSIPKEKNGKNIAMCVFVYVKMHLKGFRSGIPKTEYI